MSHHSSSPLILLNVFPFNPLECSAYLLANVLDIYVHQLNHRKVLDGMFETCGVPEGNFRPISSAVDKLDKVVTCTLCVFYVTGLIY